MKLCQQKIVADPTERIPCLFGCAGCGGGAEVVDGEGAAPRVPKQPEDPAVLDVVLHPEMFCLDSKLFVFVPC